MSSLSIWKSWILQIAVLAGSAAALLSLISHAPVRVACLRGGLAWLAVVLLGKAVGLVLVWVEELERRRELDNEVHADQEGGTA